MSLVQNKFRSNKLTRNWRFYASPIALTISAFSLASCSNANGESETSSDGALHGELHIYRINYLDGHSEREFYLAPDDKTPADTRLIFGGDPELDPWTRVRVWGSSTPEGFKVTRYETEPVDEDLASTSAAILNPTKKTRTVGFVIMDPTGQGVNLTTANAQTAIFGTRTATQAGLNQFYTEVSYGGLSFSGEILGPVTVTTLGTCQQSAITQIENGWASQFGKTFNHWMTYIGQNYTSCGWSGIGGEGTASRPASGSWYNASTGCTVLAQEVGHNLGMMHSNSLRCSGASFADDPLTCTGAEYGNRHSVMGSGCGHLTAYDKWYEGFFQGCNAVRATASGTYTLLPTEIACDGVQALQIPMPKTRPFRNTQGVNTTVNLSKYYLELRTKTGIDGNESAPSVLVMVGNEVPAASKYSEFSWVLDMNPSTTNAFDGMSKGQTFNDPAGGVSFTVTELDATHATVDVTVANSSGGPTCMDGTTFAPPGPASCGTSPGMGGSGGTGGSGGSGMGGSASGGTSNGGKSGMAGGPGSGGKASGGAGGTMSGGNGGMSKGGAAGNAGSSNGGSGNSNGGSNNGGSNNAGSNNGGSNSAGANSAGSNNNNSGGNAGSNSGSGGSNNPSGGNPSGGSNNGTGGANSAGNPATSGAPSAGNGNNSAGSSSAHGGGGNAPPDVGGCSCRTVPNEPHHSAWGLAGLLGIGLAARRRRK